MLTIVFIPDKPGVPRVCIRRPAANCRTPSFRHAKERLHSGLARQPSAGPHVHLRMRVRAFIHHPPRAPETRPVHTRADCLGRLFFWYLHLYPPPAQLP